MCVAIQQGFVSSNLAQKNPGTLNHARWLTLANRLLRLYVSTLQPSRSLKRLVSFIVNYYAPCWFQIKSHSLCTDGSKNLFYQIQLSRNLPQEDIHIVQPVIARNAFFCHPENMLISMLADSDKDIRINAVNKILQCREKALSEINTVRSFILPEVNFDALNYISMIDWSKTAFAEPPLTLDMSDAEVRHLLKEPIRLPYPCHTQAVERTVKLVTDSSLKCCGQNNRHGWILNVLKSRKMKPSFQSKQDDRL
jgi:hypothetical protein